MTHPRGYETNPLRPGAPLPPEITELIPPSLGDIYDEIARAEVELMYAIAKHRKAWRVMRQRAEQRDLDADRLNMLPTLESDPHWKKATGDVAWWRGEMEARAAALQALEGMRERAMARRGRQGHQPPADSQADKPGALAGVPVRTVVGAYRDRMVARRFPPRPTGSEYSVAKQWLEWTGGNIADPTLRLAAETIVREYERAAQAATHEHRASCDDAGGNHVCGFA